MSPTLVRCALMVTTLVAGLLAASMARADDYEVIRQRRWEQKMKYASSAPAQVAGLLAVMDPNGSFTDINYASDSDARNHVKRLGKLAQAYQYGSYQDPQIKDRIYDGMEYWLDLDPVAANWWYNYIGYPVELWPPLLLMREELRNDDPDLLQRGVDYLQEAWEADPGYRTGANLLDQNDIRISRAIIADPEQPGTLTDAVVTTGDELDFKAVVGVQKDWSFTQHCTFGLQLHSGSYGSVFAARVGSIAWGMRDTSFAMSAQDVDQFENFMLEGMQWMSYGNLVDYGTQGRSNTRPGTSSYSNTSTGAKALLAPLDDLVEMNSPRQAELQAFRDRIYSDSRTSTNHISGNRMFWRTDFQVHRRRDYYTSVRMTSTRTVGNEAGGGVYTDGLPNEGRMNYHMGDGVNLILRSGNEYDNIAPVWDWRHVPGTTVEQSANPNDPLPMHYSGQGGLGGTDYAGSVSDGTYGASGFHFLRDNVEAKKSWFFFEDEHVALGAGIDAAGATYPVHTSLNQSLQSGGVTYRSAAAQQSLASGVTNLSDPDWVHHDGVGYLFLGAAGNVTLQAVQQNGSWWDINRKESAAPISEDVFSLWVDHGTTPTNAGYSYVVRPNIYAFEMDAYAAGLAIEVLSNSSTVQAVRHNGLGITQAAFYAAETLALTPTVSVTTDQALMLMLEQADDDSITVSLSDPKQREDLTVNMTFENWWLTGDGALWDPVLGVTDVSFILPGGDDAGRTQKRTYSVIPEPAGFVLLLAAGLPLLLGGGRWSSPGLTSSRPPGPVNPSHCR